MVDNLDTKMGELTVSSPNRSRRLCTHPGKYGDILWSLLVAREFALQDGAPVDFAIRSPYEPLLPLLRMQRYIGQAFVIPNWSSWGSPYGDQPFESPEFPCREEYDIINDLGYRRHPGCPLAQAMAEEQHIQLTHLDEPWIEVTSESEIKSNSDQVAMGFGETMYEKSMFLRFLAMRLPAIKFLDVEEMNWVEACHTIKTSLCFLGSRSSNSVLAFGLGKPMIIFEPAGPRNKPCFAAPPSSPSAIIGGNDIQVRLPCQAADIIQALQRLGGQFPLFAPITYQAELPFYLSLYPDVRMAGMNTPELARAHFVRYGIHEGRIWHFDPVLYSFLYPDMQGVSPEMMKLHFLLFGNKESRLCCRKAVPM